MGNDSGIETLLDLHDQIIDQGGGYWIKIEAWRIDQDAQQLLIDFFSEVDRVLKEAKEK